MGNELTTPTSKPRLIVGFDYLRVLAAWGVVWIHGSDTHPTTRALQDYVAFAVPVFVMMSAFLTQWRLLRKGAIEGVRALLVRRCRRLLPAYLVWSLVYVLLRVGKRVVLGLPGLRVDWFSVLFCGGASYQLYFVPLVIMWTTLLSPLMFYVARRDATRWVGLGVLGLGILLVWAGKCISLPFAVPDEYMIVGFAKELTGYFLVGMGVCILYHRSVEAAATRRWNARLWIVTIAGISAAFLLRGCGVLRPVFVLLFSVSVWLGGLLPQWPQGRIVTRYLGPAAFGIYLSHGIFVEGLQTCCMLLSIGLDQMVVTVGIIVCAFVGSACLSVLLMRSRRTRWLVA